jgi:hypothetical protein|mmetsp:Transcript_11856/g.1781  ORF Transcript_11856/g.1781 Transcript_11856/m.1781 type:complete len:90 (-) Transcript_11856:35-304(-)
MGFKTIAHLKQQTFTKNSDWILVKKLSEMDKFGKKVLSRTAKGKALAKRLKRDNTKKEFLSEFGKVVLDYNKAESSIEIRHRFLIGLKE